MNTQAWFDLIRQIPLPVQSRLDHRGSFGTAKAPLFPPPGAFAAIGGRPAVARLVDGLYDRIEADAALRPAFPHDLTRHREHVKLFFEAWLGGDQAYFDAEWRLGLGPTHRGVSISGGMAGRWLAHFFASFSAVVQDPAVARRIRPSISRLALALVNRTDEPVAGERLIGSHSGESAIRPFMPFIQRDDAQGIASVAQDYPAEALQNGPLLLLLASVRGKARAAEALLELAQPMDVNLPAMLPGSEAHTSGLPMLHMTPLCGALARQRESVVRLLARHGARYDIFSASFTGDLDAVRELLDLAPDLADARDPACDVAQVTPLMHAVFAAQVEAARLLLERGATIGANGVRLVRSAANAGAEALTDLLLAHGADSSAIGAGPWVMLPAIAAKLIAHGANVNHEPGAWVGLCCTGNSGHKENAVYALALLRCGADVAARYKGRTALHCAAKAGFAEVVKALLEHGADVNALDDRGRTPLEELENGAASIDREPVRRLLKAHGARMALAGAAFKGGTRL